MNLKTKNLKTVMSGLIVSFSSVVYAADPVVPKETEERESPERTAKIKQANDLKAEISARFNNLQRERDRQGKISSELVSKSGSGCFANVKMEKLEILVKGGWVDKAIRGESDDRYTSQGNPSVVTFQLGADISISNDEKSQALFAASGRKVITDFADKKIGDIEFLKITKGGLGWDSIESCSGIIIKDCKFENYEKDMYRMDSIEIKVNDETIYKKALSTGHLFCGGGVPTRSDGCKGKMNWSEENLKINEAWLKLMQREDCPQGK